MGEGGGTAAEVDDLFIPSEERGKEKMGGGGWDGWEREERRGGLGIVPKTVRGWERSSCAIDGGETPRDTGSGIEGVLGLLPFHTPVRSAD